MKGLKKVALASAIAAVSAGAQAELKALDDSAMGELTGQAGLTIDLETKYEIGEFMYKDAGSVYLRGMRMGGHEVDPTATEGLDRLGMLDNIRMFIDIAGDTATGDNVLDRGLSEFYGADGLASTLLQLAGANGVTLKSEARLQGLAGGIEANANGNSLKFLESNGQQATTAAIATALGGKVIEQREAIGDGDLVIHFTATDHLDYEGGLLTASGATYGSALQVEAGSWLADAEFGSSKEADAGSLAYAVTHAVDFRFEIDEIGIADSGFTAGDSYDHTLDDTAQTDGHYAGSTTLISDLGIQGYLGPVDIHIENDGNGFEGFAGAADAGKADSVIHWDSYFNITDLDVYIDIAGVSIQDLKINNKRGDESGLDGFDSFGFAHSMRDIYAVKDAVLNYDTMANAGGTSTGSNPDGYVDGIAINTVTKFDMDISHLSFGDTGTSIGEIYLTDVVNRTNWTISAH